MEFTKEILDCFKNLILGFEFNHKDFEEYSKEYDLQLEKMDATLYAWLKALLAKDQEITGQKIIEQLDSEYLVALSSLNLNSRVKDRLNHYKNNLHIQDLIIDLDQNVIYSAEEKDKYDIPFDSLPLMSKLLKEKSLGKSVFIMNIKDIITLYNNNLLEIIMNGVQEVEDELTEEIDYVLNTIKYPAKLLKPRL